MSYYSPQSPKNEPESNGQVLKVISIFLAFAIVVFLLLNLLVSNLINLIPPSVEQKLGTVIVPFYEKQAVDSPQQKTLNQLLDRLENNLPVKQQQQNQYQVLYIPQDTINALVIPGNRVIIYRGLLKEVASENELMMILGHELGHFAHRDHLRGLGNALIIRMTLGYFLGDLGIFQSSVSTLVRVISQAQYSQNQEKQADEFGLRLLYETYGRVAGATDFFARLSQKKSNKIDFFASHPAPARRVKEIKKLIEENNYTVGSLTPLPETLKFE